MCEHPKEKLLANVVSLEFYQGKLRVIVFITCECGACWTGADYNAIQTNEQRENG